MSCEESMQTYVLSTSFNVRIADWNYNGLPAILSMRYFATEMHLIMWYFHLISFYHHAWSFVCLLFAYSSLKSVLQPFALHWLHAEVWEVLIMRSSLTIHLIRQARSTSALPENLCSFSIDGIKELDRKH